MSFICIKVSISAIKKISPYHYERLESMERTYGFDFHNDATYYSDSESTEETGIYYSVRRQDLISEEDFYQMLDNVLGDLVQDLKEKTGIEIYPFFMDEDDLSPDTDEDIMNTIIWRISERCLSASGFKTNLLTDNDVSFFSVRVLY